MARAKAKTKSPKFLYDNFVAEISKRLERELSRQKVVHNFEHGDEFEIALCEVLRPLLPHKYGICRGYVVNEKGEKAGNDIIVFDRMRCPTIRGLEQEDYSRREQVPIEAVYAYIEAKHTLELEGDGGASLKQAMSQVSKVKRLCHEREEVRDMVTIVEAFCPQPPLRNPPFGAIISRGVRLRRRAVIMSSAETIREHLLEFNAFPDIYPDLTVIGKNNLLLPVINDPRFKQWTMPSPFFIPGESQLIAQNAPVIAFGFGVFVLLWALDSIQLGNMPWTKILSDCLSRYAAP